MKVFLLGAILDNVCFEKAAQVIDGLIYNDLTKKASIEAGLADSDFLIADIGNINNVPLAQTLNDSCHHIGQRIEGGGVLLCFSGREFNDGLNYTWLKNIGLNLLPENLQANDILFKGNYPFITDFTRYVKLFFHSVIFRNQFQLPAYCSQIALNKSGNCAGVYWKLGKGHIFIVPDCRDKNYFTKFFIDTIIPKIETIFVVDGGSKEMVPKEISGLKVKGQSDLEVQIESQKLKIEEEQKKLVILEKQFEELDEWKQLLWQTGTPLENIVKKFFEAFAGLTLEKKETDLVGEYNGKELFIEVKGNVGCINHKSDFRQIEERKNYDAKDPQNTIALLVGNPFRLHPLEKRPPEAEHLFAHTSIPIAERLGIGLIWTKELFDIVNDLLLSSDPDQKNLLLTN